ncbi:restriction endonuclease subunit S [Peribacillus butanolivorans]|uniref:restriction endonuclease subunit S n=1 Tax=Peribacillus butanolivorans TaxID=421767 RepID=UPI0036DEB48F
MDPLKLKELKDETEMFYPFYGQATINNGIISYHQLTNKVLNNKNGKPTILIHSNNQNIVYLETPFYLKDGHGATSVLQSIKLNKLNQMFIIASIDKVIKNKYSYNTKATKIELKNTVISLPTKNGKVDFDFMESFIAELETERVGELESYLTATGLKDCELTEEEERAIRSFNEVEWKEYQMKYLFERINTKKLPYKAKELPKEPTGKYILPCLTSSFMNQGLNYFAPKENATILENVISIPSNSDVYRAYFQSREFTVLSDAYAIKWIYDNRELSKNQYLFTVPCINEVTDLPKYSYKNKLGGWNVVRNKFISLPIKNNKPDYEFMETLISAIQKLVIKDVVLYTNRKIDSAKSVVNKNSIEEIKKP